MDYITWVACPSANKECARKNLIQWKDLGYKIAILGEDSYGIADHFIYINDKDYKSTTWAFNKILSELQQNLVWAISDDVLPDKNFTAEDIHKRYLNIFPNYEGLLEPCKGKIGSEHFIVGLPIIGHNYFKKHGHQNLEYNHFFADNELYVTSTRRNLLFKDNGVEYNHNHWTKNGSSRPEHMIRWKERHELDRQTFIRRQNEEFK